MKKYLLLIFAMTLVFSCKKDEVSDVVDPVNNVVYELSSVSGSNITGRVTFTRNEDNSTTVYIRLTNPTSPIHPASINFNSREQGGDVAITLNACECVESTTMVTNLDSGSAIDFDELRNFNGHVNIYLSETDSDTIVAQVNIGSNKD